MDALPANHAALVRVARRFEAQALGSFLQPVFGEAPKGLLSGGAAEAQWRPMLVEHYARAWTDRGGVGIADSVYRELLRAQGAQDPQSAARPGSTTGPAAEAASPAAAAAGTPPVASPAPTLQEGTPS